MSFETTWKNAVASGGVGRAATAVVIAVVIIVALLALPGVLIAWALGVIFGTPFGPVLGIYAGVILLVSMYRRR